MPRILRVENVRARLNPLSVPCDQYPEVDMPLLAK
jgi:hypothetical protein